MLQTSRTEAVVRFLYPTQHGMLGGVQLPASALQVSTAVINILKDHLAMLGFGSMAC